MTARTKRAPVPDLMAALEPGTAMLDARGYRRPPHTLPGARKGRPPANAGRRYPADPPTVEEVVAMLEACRPRPAEQRLRALIVLLWRSGLRISEALALTEQDLDRDGGSLLVRSGKGGKRRLVGMDPWGWQHLDPWPEQRLEYARGALFCVIDGPTVGRPIGAASVRHDLHALADRVGIRRRIAPHQLRHLHAIELAREDVNLFLVSRQLGHSNLAVTNTYLQGIQPAEVLNAIHRRPAPTITALALSGGGGRG